MRQLSPGIFLSLVAIGCTTMPAGQTASDNESRNIVAAEDGRVRQGLTFAEAHCAACHNVADGQASSNPQAPPFIAIANTRGLTDGTLTNWLSDSHNYPELMDFEIASADIDDLAAYILTLQSADYKQPIQ